MYPLFSPHSLNSYTTIIGSCYIVNFREECILTMKSRKYLTLLLNTFIWDPNALLTEIVGRIRMIFVPRKGKSDISLDGITFVCYLGEDRTYRRIYAGAYQNEIICVLRRYLHPGDQFH